MWYQVPEIKPKPAEMPKPIFPWEQEPDRPKPTRVFAEDLSPEPTPAVLSPTHAFSTVHYDEGDRAAPVAAEKVRDLGNAFAQNSADQRCQSYQHNSGNAWDNVPGIDNYVRAISDMSGIRGKNQSLRQSTGTDDISSPLLDRRQRRESLILTDFPSAVERPSLPVTPAPVRRPMFWGEERNQSGELPSATGVPDQTEWVCQRCAFSSFNPSDFQHRRKSMSSDTTAVPSPLSYLFSPKFSLAAEAPSSVEPDYSSEEAMEDVEFTPPSFFPPTATKRSLSQWCTTGISD
jgi:glycogenin glucosyltransferase